MKRYLKNKSFLTGAILAFIMLGMLVVSLFWLPYDPEEMYLAPKLSLPSISHLMGTDQFGRDVMSRIMKGIQVSFGIGVVVVAAGGLVGTLLGACSGYFGGYVDEVIMKIVDAQMAFPGILLALMLMNADVYIWTRFKQYDSGIVNHVHSAFCTYGAKRIFKAS